MVRLLGLIFLSVSLSACSAGYVMRAAYEESKILCGRRDIKKVIADEGTNAEIRRKLILVEDARNYAEKIGLKPGQSFTKFYQLDREVLAWVLMGSKKDSFGLKTWWFPIVGSVPYKGFFEKEDAESASEELKKKDFETWLRPTEAFSTLGWFNDPVMSTTLNNSDARIVNTVLHESLHSTVWIKDSVPFNESLANFIGNEAGVNYFESRLNENLSDQTLKDSLEKGLAEAKGTLAISYELNNILHELYSELETLYNSSKSHEEKVAERSIIFDRVMGPVRQRYPGLKILKEVNNAEIMQLRIYFTYLDRFRSVFERCGRDYNKFLQAMAKLKELEGDPFDGLGQLG